MGYKLAVLVASWKISEDLDSGNRIRLQYNGVRLAKADAKLGFIHPKYLTRGLSVRSLIYGQSIVRQLMF